MTGIMKEDIPELGLKAGDVVRVVSTAKSIGRKTIKLDDGKTHVIDAWRVEETVEGVER